MVQKAGDRKRLFCQYGSLILAGMSEEFCAEIDNVREGSDIEAIHRMRVASRRLRAALPVFSKCFSGKAYRKISREIRRITGDLGQARDLDVQIAYLEEMIATQTDGHGLMVEGLGLLLGEIRAKREELHPRVVADCTRLEEKGILFLLLKEIRAWKRKPSAIPEPNRQPASLPTSQAYKAIRKRIDCLEGYAPAVQEPGATEAHHAMRIAAKKLRYLLEVYSPLYGKRFKPFIRKLKTLQEILGNLHDCDVWIAQLERAAGMEQAGPVRGDIALAAGMRFVFEDRKRARDEYYLLLKEEWAGIEGSGMLSEIETIARSGLSQKKGDSFTRQ